MELLKDFQIKDIVISEDFRNTAPGSRKMEHAEQRYFETGSLPVNIVINDDNVLIDGYITYLLAVKHGIVQMDVYRGYIEVIEAAHYPLSAKVYSWIVPPYLIGKVQEGDRCIVRTAKGVKRVTVKSVMHCQYKKQDHRLKSVIKLVQKGGM